MRACALRGLCAAKDGASQQPSSLPEPPPRRITGRVGGLSIGRQRELLKRYKARSAADATKAGAAGQRKRINNASLASQEREEAPAPPLVRRSRPAPFVQSSTEALHVSVTRDARERELERAREERRVEEAGTLKRAMRNGLILVDAYNVINKWPKCAAHFAAGDLLAARDILVSEVLGYAAYRGARPADVLMRSLVPAGMHSVKVVIVFDAITSAQSEAQRESLSELVDVVFSAGGTGTADEFIETEVRNLMMGKDPPLIYVATSDRVSGDVSFGSGAVMIASDQFIRNIIKTDEEAKELIRRNRTNANGKDGRRVIARLDPGTSNSLLALRSRLNEEAKQRTKKQ